MDDNSVLFLPHCTLNDWIMYLDACLLFSVRIWDFFSLYFFSETQLLCLWRLPSKWSKKNSLNTDAGIQLQKKQWTKNCTNTSCSPRARGTLHFHLIGLLAEDGFAFVCFALVDIPTRGSRQNTLFHVFSIDGKVTTLLTLPAKSLIYALFWYKLYRLSTMEAGRCMFGQNLDGFSCGLATKKLAGQPWRRYLQ